MSRRLWIAVLTMFSLSIGDGKNLVFPASFSHLSAEQVVTNSSTPPWSIGGLASSPPPGSWESNLTASSNGHVKLDCDTLLHSLLPADCREAWRQIPRYDETVYSIGNRSAGMDWDVPLPMRWPSNKGTCNIELHQLEEGFIMSDRVSGPEISNAAQFLINTCAEHMGRGGTTSPLGQRGRLALSIKAYRPNLKCDDPDAPVKRFGPTGPVQSILNKMRVSTFEQTFGKTGASKVDVPLPITISDSSGKYFVTVDIDGPPVSAQWYDLWTDAVAVAGLCVQNDKWGISTRPVSGSQGLSSITVAIRNTTDNGSIE